MKPDPNRDRSFIVTCHDLHLPQSTWTKVVSLNGDEHTNRDCQRRAEQQREQKWNMCVNSFVFVVLLSQWSSVDVLFSLEMKYSKIYRIKSIINIDLSYINVLYSVCVCVCVKMMLNKTSTDLVKSNSLLWYRIIKKKGNLFKGLELVICVID